MERGGVTEYSYARLGEDVVHAADKLRSMGVTPGMRVGLRAPNSYNWIVHDLALLELRAVSVAFTDDFADSSASELIERYHLGLMLVTEEERSEQAAIAVIDGDNEGVRAIESATVEPDERFERPSLIFSSGSAGGIKGMIINRRGVEVTVHAFTQCVAPTEDDRLLLFLPMSNYQQRMMYYAAFWYGFDLIVATPVQLFRALKKLSPTIVIAPPMFFDAFERSFVGLPRWKRHLIDLVIALLGILPVANWRTRAVRRIFRSAHEALGGKMRFMITGMAPIKRSTLNLFRRMQLPLFETYGLSESGAVSLNRPGANKIGSVGRPLPGIEISFSSEGEILVDREHRLTHGYFQSAEGEAELTYLEDGRVATGDIGYQDEDGFLFLRGRNKDIIVTPGGTKLHPEVVEAELDRCEDIEKSVVFPGAEDRGLVAVVVPREGEDAEAVGRVERFIEKLGQRNPAMAVSRIVFSAEQLSLENGLRRPNLKLDRREIARRFGLEA